MNNFFRAIIAGYGAKKLGGGCFGTIVVFIIIWVALGQCSFSSRDVPPPETYPANQRAEVICPSPFVSVIVNWKVQVEEKRPGPVAVQREIAGAYPILAMECFPKDLHEIYFVS